MAAFFVSSRCRVPVTPILSLFAAAGTIQFIAIFRNATRLHRTGLTAAALGAVVILNLPAFETRQSLAAERLFFQANAFANERRFAEARMYYRRAAALDPTDARPRRGLADRLEADGEQNEAVDLWRDVILIGPYSARDRDRLVTLLMKLNRRAEAAAALTDDIAATNNVERQAVAHFRLGILHFEDGRLAEALQEFRRACELDPKQGARSLLRRGRERRGETLADSVGADAFWRDLAG